MKTVYLLSSAALISLCSAFLGGVITYEFLCHRPIENLRVRNLEIEDSKGRVLAGLGAENDGSAHLRFLSPHQEPLLLIGTEVENPSSKAETEQRPFIRLDGPDRRHAIEMSTYQGGNGVISFDSEKRSSTLLLGYYGIDGDVRPVDGDHFAWGLHISREHGETGIGIVDKSGFPATYISPRSNPNAIRRQK